MSDDFSSQIAVEAYVEEAVTASLRRLQLEQLPICLFHDEANFRYIEALFKMQQKGLVKSVGSSVMTPPTTVDIIESGQAEYVQIPASALDHRFLRSGVNQAATKAKVTLLVRSVYLQGLLLMPEERVPDELGAVIPARQALRELALQAGVTLEELAIRFALRLPAVRCVVVGADTVAQVRHNAGLVARGPLPDDLYEKVLQAVPSLPDNIVMPTLWSKRMPTAVAVSR